MSVTEHPTLYQCLCFWEPLAAAFECLITIRLIKWHIKNLTCPIGKYSSFRFKDKCKATSATLKNAYFLILQCINEIISDNTSNIVTTMPAENLAASSTWHQHDVSQPLSGPCAHPCRSSQCHCCPQQALVAPVTTPWISWNTHCNLPTASRAALPHFQVCSFNSRQTLVHAGIFKWIVMDFKVCSALCWNGTTLMLFIICFPKLQFVIHASFQNVLSAD